MEEKQVYQIKISVYESGKSRIEQVDAHPEHVKDVLLRHAVMIERAIIKSEIVQLLKPKVNDNLPSMDEILRTKQ